MTNNNRILLVTGASSDLGRGLIRKVYKDYDVIWAHYNKSEYLVQELREELSESIIPIRADFLDKASTSSLIDDILETGLLPDHIVHFPAPKLNYLQFTKCEWDSYQREFDISFRSIAMILRTFVPAMCKKEYGKIVFMLTAYMFDSAPKFLAPYISIKFALLGLMKNLSAEYAKKGICVNAVSPDMIDTSFLSDLPELIKERNARNNTLGRILTTDEVIPTIEYLLSSESDLVTGQNIAVKG